MEDVLKAIIAGATGLTGSQLVRELESNSGFGKLIVLSRRALDPGSAKTVVHPIDFDKAEEYTAITVCDVAFCCLGTTIKKAGSREQFELVDQEYVLRFAGIAARSGARKLLIISSAGANQFSSNFYLSVKGRMEQKVPEIFRQQIAFFRPSLLVGKRSENRTGEKIMIRIAKVLEPLFQISKLEKYRPMPVEKLARAMVRIAGEEWEGIRVVTNREIHRAGA